MYFFFGDNLTSQPFFNDVLQTKEHGVCKFPSAALEVRVYRCRVGRVLKMMRDLSEQKFTLLYYKSNLNLITVQHLSYILRRSWQGDSYMNLALMGT